MDMAEEKAEEQKEEDIDFNFQFYSTKNLTNSAPNTTTAPEYKPYRVCLLNNGYLIK